MSRATAIAGRSARRPRFAILDAAETPVLGARLRGRLGARHRPGGGRQPRACPPLSRVQGRDLPRRAEAQRGRHPGRGRRDRRPRRAPCRSCCGRACSDTAPYLRLVAHSALQRSSLRQHHGQVPARRSGSSSSPRRERPGARDGGAGCAAASPRRSPLSSRCTWGGPPLEPWILRAAGSEDFDEETLARDWSASCSASPPSSSPVATADDGEPILAEARRGERSGGPVIPFTCRSILRSGVAPVAQRPDNGYPTSPTCNRRHSVDTRGTVMAAPDARDYGVKPEWRPGRPKVRPGRLLLQWGISALALYLAAFITPGRQRGGPGRSPRGRRPDRRPQRRPSADRRRPAPPLHARRRLPAGARPGRADGDGRGRRLGHDLHGRLLLRRPSSPRWPRLRSR